MRRRFLRHAFVGVISFLVGREKTDDGAERDSRKDEAVVFIFIFATAGLLGWAAIKPWVGKWVEVSPMLDLMGRGGR